MREGQRIGGLKSYGFAASVEVGKAVTCISRWRWKDI